MRRITLLPVLILATFLVGCAGDEEEPTASPTPIEIASATPTQTTTPTSEPTATSTPSTTPTPDGENGLPIVDLTGDPALDTVIEVVRAGDVEGLAALMRPHEVACTELTGAGGPPKCWEGGGAPENVPDGTVIQSFPMGTCHLEWQSDTAVAADVMLDEAGEWYAAISVDGPLFGGETFFGEAYLPSPNLGLIFETPTGPLLLLLDGEGVVYASRICGADAEPAEFLEHFFELPAEGTTVTHRGPAWEA